MVGDQSWTDWKSHVLCPSGRWPVTRVRGPVHGDGRWLVRGLLVHWAIGWLLLARW